MNEYARFNSVKLKSIKDKNLKFIDMIKGNWKRSRQKHLSLVDSNPFAPGKVMQTISVLPHTNDNQSSSLLSRKPRTKKSTISQSKKRKANRR